MSSTSVLTPNCSELLKQLAEASWSYTCVPRTRNAVFNQLKSSSVVRIDFSQKQGVRTAKLEMAHDSYIRPQNAGRRYEAVLRLREALSVCAEPQDLTKILSERLRDFIAFLRFYIVVYKENSTDVEWAVVGREKNLGSSRS